MTDGPFPPLTPEERQRLKAKLELGGGGIPLTEGYEVCLRLLRTAEVLEAERDQAVTALQAVLKRVQSGVDWPRSS